MTKIIRPKYPFPAMVEACKSYDPQSPPAEFPVGTWLMDRYGATTLRREDGYGEPGFYPMGKWGPMWESRGPFVPCSPWGTEEKNAAERSKSSEVEKADLSKLLPDTEHYEVWEVSLKMGVNGLEKKTRCADGNPMQEGFARVRADEYTDEEKTNARIEMRKPRRYFVAVKCMTRREVV